jgi:hypothetical protein
MYIISEFARSIFTRRRRTVFDVLQSFVSGRPLILFIYSLASIMFILNLIYASVMALRRANLASMSKQKISFQMIILIH